MKVIVLLGDAFPLLLMIASLKEPPPLSLLFVTVKLAPCMARGDQRRNRLKLTMVLEEGLIVSLKNV